MKELTVYYSPSCAFSAGAVSFLILRGADFRLVNLEQHPDERSRLGRELTGRKLETPLFAVGRRLLVAPSLSKLKTLLQSWDLPARAAPHQQLEGRTRACGGRSRPPGTGALEKGRSTC